jgi:hypothetical protein
MRCAKLQRPFAFRCAVPSWNAFWVERSRTWIVRLQNSITGQCLPLALSVCPKLTGLGETLSVGELAAAAGAARTRQMAMTARMAASMPPVRRILLATCLLAVAAAVPARAAAPDSCGAPQPTKVITGTFTSDQTGSFVMVPFAVGKGTTAIRGWYCYDQPDSPTSSQVRHTIDFGYYAPRPAGQKLWTMQQYRGWSGSGFFKDITVSAQGYADEPDPSKKPVGTTSRGYRPGPIRPGTWAVELGVAAVVPPAQGDSDGSVNWRVELKLETDPKYARPKYKPATYDATPAVAKPGWYAGDFHVHTDQSGDAKQDAPAGDVFDYAFGPAGLDFVQATDHNTDGGWGEWGRYQADHPAQLIARNEEITTYRGHVNAPGIGRIADYRTGPVYVRAAGGALKLLRKARPISDVFRAVHAAGGITTINHPTIFDSAIPPFAIICRGCSWEYSDDETSYPDVDAIEVETGPQGLKTGTMPGPSPFTPLAIQFYEDALDKAGHVIAAVSGSDSHSGGNSGPNDVTGTPVGSPATMVFARELSERGIADGVHAGHTYVRSFGTASPELTFTAGDAIMGDTVHAPSAEFTATVKGTGAGPEPHTLEVTKNGSVLQATAADTITVSADAPAHGTDHYGIQVMRGTAIEAFSTPIFLTRDPARALLASPLVGKRLRVRGGRVVVPCRATGEGLRACRVKVGRATGEAVLYRPGVARVTVRLKRRAGRVTVSAIALGDGTQSAPRARRVSLRPGRRR